LGWDQWWESAKNEKPFTGLYSKIENGAKQKGRIDPPLCARGSEQAPNASFKALIGDRNRPGIG